MTTEQKHITAESVSEHFSWIPFYMEMADKLLQFKSDRKDLIEIVYSLDEEYVNYIKDNEGGRYSDIDPFSVFAIFNRGLTTQKRIAIATHFKNKLGIDAPVPADFDGIPVMNNQQSVFVWRGNIATDVQPLWDFFEYVITHNAEKLKEAFDVVVKQKGIKWNITMGLFWIRPYDYIALDSRNRDYLQKLGFEVFNEKDLNANNYFDLLSKLTLKLQDGSILDEDIPNLSHNAYMLELQKKETQNYWVYSPGENASKWQRCQDEKIMCIGWDNMGDLSFYNSRDKITDKLREISSNSKSSFRNDCLALWEFANVVKPGDIVYAKQGRNKIIGRGVVKGSYQYDTKYDDFFHIISVDWLQVGEWESPQKNITKTLTNISIYTDYVKALENMFLSSTSRQYWWLVASPKIWSLVDMEVGEVENYTLYNDNGNRRRVFKNFLDAKEGDIVIGYEASPTKQIVALAEVAKENDGKAIYFRKTESLQTPIDYASITTIPGLEDMEYLKNQQGSFYKLTETEYNILIQLIRKFNPISTEPMTKKHQKYIDLLKEAKNLVLTGAPGTGKTTMAQSIAEEMGAEVKFVQFHPSYDYTDFVEGLRPVDNGNGQIGFERKDGVFKEFCKVAIKNIADSEKSVEKKPFVFIIDEINRGEASKIFGELFYAIDPGYRGKTNVLVQTQYQNLVPESDIFAKGFYVPENVYILATMNDIDRSVESMDFAMRRRFTWQEIKPEDTQEMLDSLSCAAKAKATMERLNKVIADTDGLGAAYMIGPSYFLKLKENGENFDKLWEMNIEPLLKEYLRGFRDAKKTLKGFEAAYKENGTTDASKSEDDDDNADR